MGIDTLSPSTHSTLPDTDTWTSYPSGLRYNGVDSLYGPGTVGCWLFTLLSVFLSWTLHPTLAKKDTLTNDFIAALTLPAIAAAHALYQLFNLATSTRELQMLTKHTDLQKIQRAAGIEAAVNICDTFSTYVLVLLALSAHRAHWKRLGLLVLVMTATYGTEVYLFWTARVPPNLSIFNRTYVFNFPAIMITTVVLVTVEISILVFVGMGTVIAGALRTYRSRDETRSRPSIPHWPGVGHLKAPTERQPRIGHRRNAVMKIPAFLGAGLTPITIGLSTICATGYIGCTPRGYLRTPLMRALFFVPRSNASLTQLEQMVALAGGVISTAFSLREIVKARRERTKARTRSKKNEEVEPQSGNPRHGNRAQQVDLRRGRLPSGGHRDHQRGSGGSRGAGMTRRRLSV